MNTPEWRERPIGRELWYERFGAVRLLDNPLNLILPLAAIADLVTIAGS